MEQERDQIHQIDEARRRVAEDVRDVAENGNVVERTKESVGDRVRDARDKLEEARNTMQNSMRSMTDNIGNTNLMENPIGMLVAGLGVGFLIGMLLPVKRFETERMGPMTEDIKDHARQAGGEVVRRETEVIIESIESSQEATFNPE